MKDHSVHCREAQKVWKCLGKNCNLRILIVRYFSSFQSPGHEQDQNNKSPKVEPRKWMEAVAFTLSRCRKDSKDLGESWSTLGISHVTPDRSLTIGFIYLQAGTVTVTVNIWICAKQFI